MDTASGPKTSIKTPSLRQGRQAAIRTLIALIGAPAAWMVQILLSEPLVAHACYPYQAPLSAPIWEKLPLLLAAISLVSLAAALLSGFIAWTSWREEESKLAGGDTGEMKNRRSRFLGKLGVMSSLIFIVAVIFNICAVSLTPLCSSWF